MKKGLDIDWMRLSSRADYRRFVTSTAPVLESRRETERALAGTDEEFSVEGRCWVCGRDVDLRVSYAFAFPVDGRLTPNWREHLWCPPCRLNGRMRASLHFLAEYVAPPADASIYVTERITPLFEALEGRYPGTVGSEYLGEQVAWGAISPEGIRNESITQLTFPAASFDVVVSLEVLEHVPDHGRALSECRRVLRRGGSFLFSVPFDPERDEHLVRARMRPDGGIEHLLPPEYHGDPLKTEGCLAFRLFGWSLLEDVREAGFGAIDAYTYWSLEFGYLGHPLLLFLARTEKPAESERPAVRSSAEARESRMRHPQAEAAALQALEGRVEPLLAEIDRLRSDLHWSYGQWQEREAELAGIRRSRMWRAWMAYQAVRRFAVRCVRSPAAAAVAVGRRLARLRPFAAGAGAARSRRLRGWRRDH